MGSFCDAAGWTIAWADEFNAPTLNTSRWNIEQGVVPWSHIEASPSKRVGADCHGAGCARLGSCREAACTIDSVHVRDGRLVLTSQRRHVSGRNFTTGAVNTWGKVSWRVEDAAGPFRMCIRAKLPGSPGHAAGVWPAHWLMPHDDSCDPDEGEMDIMEMVDGDGTVYSTYHWQEDFPSVRCAFPKNHQSVSPTPTCRAAGTRLFTSLQSSVARSTSHCH